MDAKLIGQMVRFHRKKANLSQQQLAMLSGIGKTAVFDIEQGKLSVHLSTLLQILNVLNIQIEFMSPFMLFFKKDLDEKS